MKKILLILGIGLLALLIIVSVVVWFYIGPIVKIGIEQYGPKVTQVSVQLDSVDLALGAGSLTLKGLVVGNPQGFSAAQAFKAGTIAVSVDPFSMTSNKIVVHSIHVESPEITYERVFSGSNLTKILSNVNSFTKSNAPAGQGNAAPGSNKPAPNIEVDDFLITGAKVHINISGLDTKDIPLPDIHLTDLGKDGNGLTPVELTSAILKAIVTGTFNAVTSSVGSIGKTLGGGVGQIASGLTGLFGK